MRIQPAHPAPLLELLAEAFSEMSRTSLRQMLQQGRVRVNGEIEKRGAREIVPGDVIDVGRKEVVRQLPPQVQILHEDSDVIVIVKGEELLTVATEREKEDTAQAYLNQYLRSKGIRERVHVVHRLDRDTSGVMLFARSFEMRQRLKDRFAAHDIDRVYVAIIEGTMPEPSGTIRSFLYEDSTWTVRSTDDPHRGKLAVTHYRTLGSGNRYSMLEVTLETGRKNQIRAHLSEAGHPVIGDRRYGAATDPIGRLGLHAKLLGFIHPRTGRKMTFEAPLPDSFRRWTKWT